MKTMKWMAVLMMGLLAVAGCSVSLDGEDYVQQTPKFELEQFFDGKVMAWGIVQNRSGEVVQRFKVAIEGRREGDSLVLDERFDYQLGSGPAQRTWQIRKTSEGKFSGQASDMDTTATGTSFGNAFRFEYEMDLPVDDTYYHVAFDDWFFAIDDQTMMNRSYIRKFGLVMAEVTIFMQKQTGADE